MCYNDLSDAPTNQYYYELALLHHNLDPTSDDNLMSIVTQFQYQSVWPNTTGIGQTNFVTVNGQMSPTIPLVRGSAGLFRILYSANERVWYNFVHKPRTQGRTVCACCRGPLRLWFAKHPDNVVCQFPSPANPLPLSFLSLPPPILLVVPELDPQALPP